MPRKKREQKELPEETLPEEEILPEEEVPKVGLKPTPGPAEDRETTWGRVEAEVSTIKDDYIAGRITLAEAIDRLVASLNAIKTAEAPGLARLGAKPEMMFPTPPPAIPPEEEIPPTSSV